MTSDTGRSAALLHAALADIWCRQGPDAAYRALTSLPPEDVNALVMCHVGQTAAQCWT